MTISEYEIFLKLDATKNPQRNLARDSEAGVVTAGASPTNNKIEITKTTRVNKIENRAKK